MTVGVYNHQSIHVYASSYMAIIAPIYTYFFRSCGLNSFNKQQNFEITVHHLLKFTTKNNIQTSIMDPSALEGLNLDEDNTMRAAASMTELNAMREMESGKRLPINDADETNFEDSVLEEERIRARTLTSIRFQARHRQDSMSSNEDVLAPSTTTRGESYEGNNKMSISVDGVKEDIDVRQALFEEPEAYPHTVDFQRVIITETDGNIPMTTFARAR